MKKCFTLLLLAGLICITACRKQSFITAADASIRVTDSIRFDTVFATVGSVTQSFTIVNTNEQKLRLSTIRLMGGSASSYKINVDGINSSEVNNIDMEAGDSVYVFVSVTIDPTAANMPFIVKDSIQINYNGNERYVQLEAYGQNARFLRSHIIDSDINWTDDLPYVISGGLLVADDATLTIEKGCRIYLHADAPLVIDGTLEVNGTKTDSVTFQGDRLDADYRDLPASWPGIFLRENSKNNIFKYAIIKNAYQGLVVTGSSTNGEPKALLSACIFDNVYDIGILANSSSIEAVNCLISNCGSNLVVKGGGDYNFTYCTMAAIGNSYIEHKNPVLFVSDRDDQENTFALDAVFRNCIIWGEGGNVDDEVQAERKGNADFRLLLDHSLFKAKTIAPQIEQNSSIINQNPVFDSINANRRYFDFHLRNTSPAIGAGISAVATTDLDGRMRIDPPDIGCYTKP